MIISIADVIYLDVKNATSLTNVVAAPSGSVVVFSSVERAQ